ncbi:hypothetical protein E4U47_000297 [Claviceps purpurea]|nr:hypothetical protein E4U37_000786 [Claviceps purpurea]KAG6226897.1 hypothetical protein E4U25_007953 [Claviceps purpurea]KAG6276062.1 hypothetical protein E4U47_000297 [Claviceps purpurea]
MHALSLLAILLPLAAADTHNWCSCQSWTSGPNAKWGVNQMLSYFVCSQDFKGVAKFDVNTNRCNGLNGYKIDGDTWNGHCKAAALGYFPITMDGYMDIRGTPLKVDEAVGLCR